MSIFGFKPKTAEEVIKAIQALPEEEQEKLANALSADASDQEGTQEQNAAQSETTERSEDTEQEVIDDQSEEFAETDAESGEDSKAQEEEPLEEQEEQAIESEQDTTEHPDAQKDAAEIERIIAPLIVKIEELQAKVDALTRAPQPANETEQQKLDALAQRFTN